MYARDVCDAISSRRTGETGDFRRSITARQNANKQMN